MRINPCFGCPLRANCEDRAGWRAKASKSGFRSVTFSCPKLTAELRPGRNIEIEIPYLKEIGHGYYGETEFIFGRKLVRATVVGTYKTKFSCVVEPGQISEDDVPPNIDDIDKIRFRKARPHTTIKRFLLGPDAEIGETCGHIIRDGKCDVRPGEECHNQGMHISGEPVALGEIW